ncbi:unnamed protein product [Oppiella nova]|uniref:Uncharacterized protein n=1 Tax=Oppiella nova TaxID=334625 RepID=A0A7R9M312_9ACAR|nr:unnamed protein product [Oppiella nova]CAG2168768.1 unnamed protein product [Oppiella nova]
MDNINKTLFNYTPPLIVSEVNDYKRLYEELHSLGSGAFGEANGTMKKCITFKWSYVLIVCRIFFNTNHKYLVDNRENP